MQLSDADGLPYTRIVLHVPFGGLTYLHEKVRKFAEGSGTKGNHAFLSNISIIAQAALDALWTDDPNALPQDDKPHWWQLWIRKHPAEVWQRFQNIKESLSLEIRGKELILPEHYIVVARATYATLAASISLLDTLAEIRGAYPYSLELTDLSISEQREWVADALLRIKQPGADAPAVCLLDTGVNRGHRLVEQLLSPSDTQSVFGDGDGSDAYSKTVAHGHGTPMAGLAAYGDLRQLMLSKGNWEQRHRLESVRLFDPNRPHDPDNYGSVTLQAVALPEVQQPNRKRVFSLTITAPGPDDGRPTAWSAAVDAAAYGDEGPNSPKRVILVSAGNVRPDGDLNYAYPDDNRNTPIEDPAQAWNAISVGAITHHDRVEEPDDESKRLVRIARNGELSPFSRTSCEWDNHWPIKPEIVLEGGNVARHPENGPEYRASLEPVSTSAMGNLGAELCPANATSAATAQAARLAAEISVRYPTIWSETIRGLLVHSARWNPIMLNGVEPHRPYNKKKQNDRERFIQTLRCYGYGEPDPERSCFSARHAVTLIREDSLTPYTKKESSVTLNDCHIHSLPWPTDLLANNHASTVTLRVTLSYFTAPNPSANNALGGSRYRYGGCLLRFLVRHKDESIKKFNSRLEKAASENEDSSNGSASLEKTATDTGWALGSRLCGKSGSLVQDIWEGSAADLRVMDRIAIYPVKGWWASRKFPEGDRWHNCYQMPIRYSLIISLEAHQDIPLYNEIQNLISIPLEGA